MYSKDKGVIKLVKDIFKDLKSNEGEKVTVTGWIRKLRSSKTVCFIELNDGTCFKNLQLVVEDKLDVSTIEKLPLSTSIVVGGVLVKNPNGESLDLMVER